jgi:WD40 repeat protein
MAWPLSQDYNEAIQDPASAFNQADLKTGQPVVNALGLPMPRSGNFADVYEYQGARGSRWAIKCFTREVAGLQERYAAISSHLRQARLPFTVDFEYLAQGIRIRGRWYPILKMQWVEGFLLNEFVRNNLDKPALLDGLGQIWLRMAKRLRDANIAHADLQHGNMILVPGSRVSALAVKLIDYDGMFVPALARQKSGEVGHPAYQHPQRLQEGTYSPEVDRVPLLAIACALKALPLGGKSLYERFDNGDNLLFRESDLRQPGKSPLFQELWNIPDAAVHDLVGYLTLGLTGPLDRVPLLQDVLLGGRTRPLSRDEEQLVTASLGVGAQVTRTAAVKPAPTAIASAVPLPSESFAFADESASYRAPEADLLNFAADDPQPRSAAKTRRSRATAGSHKGLYLGIGAGTGALLATAVVLLILGAGSDRDADHPSPRDPAGDSSKDLVKGRDGNPPPRDRLPEKPPKPDPHPAKDSAREPDNLPAKPPAKPPAQALLPESERPVARPGTSQRIQNLTGQLSGVAFSPDNRFIMTGCGNLAQVWQCPSGAEVLRLEHKAPIRCVALSRKGPFALIGTGSSFVDRDGKKTIQGCAMWYWDLNNHRVLKGFKHPSTVHAVAFSPDGRYALSGSGMFEPRGQAAIPEDCLVRIWDLHTGQLVKELAGQQSWARWLAFSSDSRSVFSHALDSTLRSWNVATGRLESSFPRRVHFMSFSADGSRAIGAIGKDVTVWDKDGQVAKSFHPSQSEIQSLAVTEDFRRAAVGGGDYLMKNGDYVRDATNQAVQVNTSVFVYDLQTGKELATLNGHKHIVQTLAFSPDGHYLISSCGFALRLWDLETYRPVGVPDQNIVVNRRPSEDQPPRDQKTSVPQKALLEAAISKVKARFQQDYEKLKREDRLELASRLVKSAEEAKDTTERYALLVESSTLAAAAGDLIGAFCAIDRINQEFAVKAMDLKLAAVAQATEALTTPQAGRTMVANILEAVDQALAEDNFAVAHQLMKHAETFAGARANSLLKIVQGRAGELAEVERQFETVKPAAATLGRQPGDPEASLAWGKYLSFWKGDWEKGLPLLAQGKDASLRELAQKELARPKKASASVLLGDQWRKLAANETGVAKTQLLLHAIEWYRQALPELEKVELARVQSKIKEIELQTARLTAHPMGEIRRFTGHHRKVTCVCMTRDGRTVLSGCVSGPPRLWRAETGREIQKLDQEPDGILCAGLSPDGKYALSGGSSGKLRLWDLGAGESKLVHAIKRSDQFRCITVSSKGDLAWVVYPWGSVGKYTMQGKSVSSMGGPGWGKIRSVAVQHNGVMGVIADGHGRLHMINHEAARHEEILKMYSAEVLCVALSQDGSLLVTGAEDKTIRLWDLNMGGTPRGLLKGHKQPVTCMALSADGRHLLSGSDDKTVRVWDIKTRKLLHTFTGHTDRINSVAISGDGRFGVSGSEDQTVRVWRLVK